MMELGPFRVNEDSVTLSRNKYAWNNGKTHIFMIQRRNKTEYVNNHQSFSMQLQMYFSWNPRLELGFLTPTRLQIIKLEMYKQQKIRILF